MTQRERTDHQAAGDGCLALVARMFWMAFGNAALVLLAVMILQRNAFSRLDLAFWALAAALIVIRYLDITRLNGLTANGEPASLAHWRRYAALVLVVSTAIWLLAHAGGRLFAR